MKKIAPENELQYVGRYLVLLRRRKMKQVELAARLGVAQSQISKWERANYSYVNLEVVARAAQALGVGLDTSFKDWVIAWTTAEAQAEVERLILQYETCGHCGASLLPAETPRHCHDCVLDEDDLERADADVARLLTQRHNQGE